MKPVLKNRFMRIIDILIDAKIIYTNNSMYLIAGNIAFFTVWSIIPFILVWEFISRYISFAEPEFDVVFIGDIFNKYVDSSLFSSFNFSFGDLVLIVTLIYLSSKAFSSFIAASNKVINNYVTPRLILDRLKGMIFSVLLIFIIIFLLFIPVLGKTIVEYIVEIFPTFTLLEVAFGLLKWPLTVFMIFCVVAFIYTFAPTKFTSIKKMVPGALMTTILWVISTSIYSIYITDFANYEKVYSGFANLISFMFWIYILAQILVLGLAINAAYQKSI